MTFSDINYHRLHNQHITYQPFSSPAELVGFMGAMQAQDYEMAKWAIGLRIPSITENAVEQALNNGDILRTHVLRPTWHIVSPTDIRWMLKLSTPQLEKILAGYYKNVGLDLATRSKTNAIIEKALQIEVNLTRDELMQELSNHGIEASSNTAAHIMFHAELTGLVCSGARKGKQISYTLLDNRAPLLASFHRDEALAKLAKLYFQSHSPASLKDFTWWSGLPIGDARKAIDFIKERLEIIEIENITYYLFLSKGGKIAMHDTFLLPAFDEYMVSYTDRSSALPPQYAKQAITSNGIFTPIIVHQGQVIGLWKRTVKPKCIEIELLPFEPISPELKKHIQKRFEGYQNYMGGIMELRFL